MKLSQKSGATIAIAAAAMLVSGATLLGSVPAQAADKGQCFGVNACKGQGACKTAQNDCKGLNACKGKGFLELTEEECKEKGGEWKKS